jgi:hypothetical protein
MIAAAHADDTTLDDVIVSGSLGIGIDSQSGLNFGFDTMRLRENNLRIHFEDTSASAAFPGNDWRIIINDTLNGGDNYFAIEDATAATIPFRIEAGAPGDAIRVAKDGDVVIGSDTNTFPTAKLYVEGTGYFQGDLEVGSSRDLKEAITELDPADARGALDQMEPVRFRYKNTTNEKLGFIAEDVPELVASESRKSLSPMDFIAVLTSVVQQQQDEIAALKTRLEKIERGDTLPRQER